MMHILKEKNLSEKEWKMLVLEVDSSKTGEVTKGDFKRCLHHLIV
jgi:hypothetical protein